MGIQAQDIPESEVPSVILTRFQKDNPNVSDVEWEMKKNGQYTVEFETGLFNEHEIAYNADGKRAKTEKDIPERDLPQAVKDAIKRDFAAFNVDETKEIDEDGNLSYLVELDGEPRDKEVIFDRNGKIVEQRNE